MDATFEFIELGNRRWTIVFRNLAIHLISRFDLKRYPGSEKMNDFASSLSLCLRSSYKFAKVLSRTETVLESPRHSRGLFAVQLSLCESLNVLDFRGITDNFHVRGAFSQIFI